MATCAAIRYYFAMPDKKRTARLDWEDVRYFVALARHGTLSATARTLRVNHATVARRIASLETLLGRSLFDRRANGSENLRSIPQKGFCNTISRKPTLNRPIWQLFLVLRYRDLDFAIMRSVGGNR